MDEPRTADGAEDGGGAADEAHANAAAHSLWDSLAGLRSVVETMETGQNVSEAEVLDWASGHIDNAAERIDKLAEAPDHLDGVKRLVSELEEKHEEMMREMLTLSGGHADDAVPAAADAIPDGGRSDVDSVAHHDVSPHGGARANHNGSSLDKHAAERLPSGSSGLEYVCVMSDAGDTAKHRSLDGVHRPRDTQLGGAHADSTEDSLAALKR